MVPPNTRSINVVLETRPRQYPRRPNANLIRKNGKKEHTDDPGGTGAEIVREVRACPACAAARGSTGAER